MKSIVTIIMVVALIIVANTVIIRSITTGTEKLTEESYDLKDKILDENWEEAEEDFDSIESEWHDKRSCWEMIVNHAEFTDIERFLLQLQTAIEIKNSDDCLRSIAELISHLKSLKYRYEFTAGNIF